MDMKRLIPAVAFASMTIAAVGQSQLKSGIDLTNLDKSVSPKEDFYSYACGGWMKQHPFRQPILVTAASTSWPKPTAKTSTPFSEN